MGGLGGGGWGGEGYGAQCWIKNLLMKRKVSKTGKKNDMITLGPYNFHPHGKGVNLSLQ